MELEEEVLKAFKKLRKKDAKQLDAIKKKVDQILNDPLQFNHLRHPLEGLWRVHVGSFVLIYELCKETNTVRFLKYKHHDGTYL